MRILGARIFWRENCLVLNSCYLQSFQAFWQKNLQVCDLPKKNLLSRVFITKTAEKVILSTTEVDENLT